jgi:hypothetical protein
MTPLLVAILALSGSVTLVLSSWPFAVQRGAAGHEFARAGRFFAQGFDAGWRLAPVAVSCACLSWLWCRPDLVGRLVQAVGTVAQFGMGAAALFAGVGGEFDAVDGEHLAPDQALASQVSRTWLNRGLICSPRPHELGDVRVAGLAVAADGDELHVALAGCSMVRLEISWLTRGPWL